MVNSLTMITEQTSRTLAVVAADVMQGGTHWFMSPSRCASWLKDLDEIGLDMTPIHGGCAHAAPQLQQRILEAAARMAADN